MKAILTTHNHRVTVEPTEGQDKETLLKKVRQIARKRNMTKGLIEIDGEYFAIVVSAQR